MVGDCRQPRQFLGPPDRQREPGSLFAVQLGLWAYFNDITGKFQTTNNNGYFATVPGFDMVTGIGTPNMKALITLVSD